MPAQTGCSPAASACCTPRSPTSTGIDFDLRQGDFQKGHELPLAPKLTANGGIEKRFALGTNALTLHADLRYQSTSKVKFSPQKPIDEYDSRTEVDARATYAFGESEQPRGLAVRQQPHEREVLRGDPGPARRVGLVLLRAERR